jgi:hypothetical protein
LTCIAYDGRYLVADSMGTRGDYRLPWGVEKIRIDHDRKLVFAQSGIDVQFDQMVKWYINDANPDKMPDSVKDCGDSCLVVIGAGDPSKVNDYVTGSYGAPQKRQAPWAWGCGGLGALHALMVGANAVQAVDVSIKLNIWCGGPIQAVDMATLDWVKTEDMDALLKYRTA